MERRTPSVPVAVAAFRQLAARLPPGAVVWRYDPILVGPAFPAARHAETFGRIAAGLEGHTRRVVVSIVDVYAKTRRRLGRVLRWGEDLAPEPAAWPGLDDLLGRLVSIAEDHGLAVEACAEPQDLTSLGIAPTKCIDDALLGTLYGGTWSRTKDRGQRASCRCISSRDIGRTDTCIFGCRYCYATRADHVARARHVAHDPRAARLCD